RNRKPSRSLSWMQPVSRLRPPINSFSPVQALCRCWYKVCLLDLHRAIGLASPMELSKISSRRHAALKRQGTEDGTNDRGLRDRGNDETGPEICHLCLGKPNNLLHTHVTAPFRRSNSVNVRNVITRQ